MILLSLFAVSLAGGLDAGRPAAAAGDPGSANGAETGGDTIMPPAAFEALTETARRAGLRVLAGDHLVLVTDRPERAGDGSAELPAIFDAAWASWCRHYDLAPEAHRQWRAFGCLIVDRERFRAAGLLPEAVPDFANGFCQRHRFWMADQSNPDYRRHLLLHEGVHAFTLTLRGLDTPPWYMEGIAEYLATHRLERGDAAAPAAAGGGAARFVAAPLPLRADDVEQLGRIERIRALRAAGTCPGLEDVFKTAGTNHRDLSAYATSWAAVALLGRHPDHAAVFAAAERGPLDAAFTQRLTRLPGWDDARAVRDFDAFTDELDYGYDFARSRVDWSPGRPLDAATTLAVEAGRGWQNSGWSLRRGRRYAISATGRCGIGSLAGPPPAAPVRLETEAEGISLRWYRGRPLGRLLLAEWVERPEGGGRPRFVVRADGAVGEFSAAGDGVAFLKLNEPPGELADDAGGLTVTLTPLP